MQALLFTVLEKTMLRITIYENGAQTTVREIDPSKLTPRKLANKMEAKRLAERALKERISVAVDIDFIDR